VGRIARPGGRAAPRGTVVLFRLPGPASIDAPFSKAVIMLQAADIVIRLNPADDVVIARVEIPVGTLLVRDNVRVNVTVPAGHKIATRDVASGKPVRRYNQIIGFATRDIKAGEHVHVHNLSMGDFERDYAYCVEAKPTDFITPQATFQGIVRRHGSNAGRVATRNYIGVVTSVNCSATVAKLIARHFENRLDDFPNVDGVVALAHKTGCGMASDGEAIDILRKTTAGYIRHANFHSVLLVGLGCEANQINNLLAAQGLKRSDHLHAFTIQDKGGTRKAVEEGVARIKELLPPANDVERETVPASHLMLGLQCGGSDGYSGISANPALGAAVDLLVRHGGTAILSETPEIYGAEHLLTRRAVSRAVGEKLIRRIRWWEQYTARNGNEMNNNPSPGNKAGGLTTILEKSLGAVAKGGTTNLVDVYEYADLVTAKGFVYMDTPGYDPVSATGQVAGGANVICFTTGRGSAYGCKPAPSLKLATNTALYEKQEDDMDINCGTIVDGKESIADAGARFFELILETASGKKSKSELWGYGDDEFAPWTLGATM
jgi:altronate hydrolase